MPSPGNPQALNRYAYALNNPLRYTDPTGRFTEDEIMKHFGVKTWDEVLAFFEKGGTLEGQWGWLEVLRGAEAGDYVSARIDPWPWDSKAPAAFSGTFLLQGEQIQIGLVGGRGKRLSATEAGQVARKAKVTRYYYEHRRGHVIFFGDVAATRKHHHVQVEDWNKLLNPIEWADIADMSLIGPATQALGVGSMGLGVSMCTTGPGCIAGSRLAGSGVLEIGAGFGLEYTAYLRIREFLKDALKVTP